MTDSKNNGTAVAVLAGAPALPYLSDAKLMVFCEVAERVAGIGPYVAIDLPEFALSVGQSEYYTRATVERFVRLGLVSTLGAWPRVAVKIEPLGMMLVVEVLGEVWHDLIVRGIENPMRCQ